MKKKNKYGVKSLLCFGLSILFLVFWFIFFVNINSEIILGFFFYGAFLLVILSFILGIIGIIKDKKKILSVISIAIILLFIIGIIYYVNVILPNDIENTINNWLNVWL